jgi:subtilase family serine protease
VPRASLTASLAAIVAACAVGVPVAIATAASTHSHTAEATRALAGSAAALTEDSAGTQAVPGSQRDTVEIWMAGDQPAAQRFVTAVSTPGSPIYRRYLSPIAFTQRFGPTRGQVKAVQSYLTDQGFSAVHASANDDYVSATAPVRTINRAFSVQMRRYETAGTAGKRTAVESNDRDLTVPSTISRDILAVTGLNSSQPQAANAAIPTADTTAPCSTYWAQKIETLTPAFRGLTQAADAVCGYSAKQMRAAYGLTPADTGKGRTVAIIEVGGPSRMFQSLTDYAKANGLPAPLADQYREQAIGQGDSNAKCVNEDLEEGALDSEAVYAMAPAAHQLVIDGNDCLTTKQDGNEALFDAMLAPLTGPGAKPSASIESVSYGLLSKNESATPRSQLNVVHEIALRAAAEGVSLLAATGDYPGVEALASDPDVTAVGGTTLGIGADN